MKKEKEKEMESQQGFIEQQKNPGYERNEIQLARGLLPLIMRTAKRAGKQKNSCLFSETSGFKIFVNPKAILN